MSGEPSAPSSILTLHRPDGSEKLFDNVADPFQTRNLIDEPASAELRERFRGMLKQRMDALNDTFEACTWYRDNWTEDRIILRTATLGMGQNI